MDVLRLCALLGAAAAASHYSCLSPLGAPLPQASYRSSSQASAAVAAHNAKLNRRDGGGGWSPMVTDGEPWLQLDLRARMEVTAVATQGRHGSQDWVTWYLLLHSDTGQVWREHRQDDGVTRLAGNVNSDSVVQTKLTPPLRTRFLRFLPLQWNPSGWMGLRVEAFGCSFKSDVADFDGRSALQYRFNQKSMSTVKDVISLRFRSQQADGVLLHGEGQRGDHITLELQRGRLALYLNLDDARLRPRGGGGAGGAGAVTVGSLLDDQHWHQVLIERFNKQVNVSVDSHSQHFSTGGADDALDVDYELSFGGIPLPGKPGTFLRRNFQGCLENLYYNGINVIDLAKRRKPQMYSVGNVTFSCSQPQSAAATFPSSGSFLSLPAAAAAAPPGFLVRFQLRTWNGDGLLLDVALSGAGRRLQLLLRGGRLLLALQGGGGPGSEVTTGQRVDDGLWHSVAVDTRGLQARLSLDGHAPAAVQQWRPLEPRGSLYFGSCPPAGCPNRLPSFQGCMRLVFINNQPINISLVQQGLLGEYSLLHFDTCSITDRCLPNLCEHGGSCRQSWTSFSCECSGTGYSGATCHNSIYESSCEAYKLSGGSSGFYSIDPDGSGPLGAVQVYCNMTDEKIWTVLSHNVTSPVRVRGSSPWKPHTASFNYSASAKQLRALVAASEQCTQEVSYRCRKSRLFNPGDGRPLSWWEDRSGERRSYWGGLLPGVQQCSCSLEESCVDLNFFCNCDADSESWAVDSGVLSYKDHLPLSRLLVGDTNRSGSEAVYRVGPLRCYGDRSLWNSASFYQEDAYLHFPRLQAEPACDVSFFFKTSSPAGVFLESRGHDHFIRLELSAPSVVSLSYDVGDGVQVVALKSHLPLNDRQWHFLRAERNVKEASLQVDQLPVRFLEAPASGRRRLRLDGQLFVGGTASRQRGFLGCIRTLTINGATLDLEERAKMAPGVSPGCPGYCSGSSSLCHNRGRCIEKSSGFACDCSQSAFGGPTCKDEVSVSFDRESSVTFTFQEPFSVIQNRSSPPGVSRETGGGGRSREDVALSFVTSQTPAMLLTVSTFSRQYIAVILAGNGSLQIWYQLQADGSPDVLLPGPVGLADGRLHRVRIHREGRDVYVQMDQDMDTKHRLSSDAELVLIRSLTLGKVSVDDSLPDEVVSAGAKGFVGCLSSVQFNQVVPLKAALQNRGSSLVSLRGPLVQSNCGALADSITSHNLQDHAATAAKDKDSPGGDTGKEVAVISGVVTAVVFITLCVVAVVTRLVYRRRRQRGSEDAAEKQHGHGEEAEFRPELPQHNTVRASVKEYYI